MASNIVDHVFGNHLDFLLSTNRVGKRVAAPKRQTRPRSVSPEPREPEAQSSPGQAGNARNLRTQMNRAIAEHSSRIALP
jgi:hypothetical protein